MEGHSLTRHRNEQDLEIGESLAEGDHVEALVLEEVLKIDVEKVKSVLESSSFDAPSHVQREARVSNRNRYLVNDRGAGSAKIYRITKGNVQPTGQKGHTMRHKP